MSSAADAHLLEAARGAPEGVALRAAPVLAVDAAQPVAAAPEGQPHRQAGRQQPLDRGVERRASAATASRAGSRSGGSGSSANRRASSLIVSTASSESTSPLSEKATAHSPSRSSSCTAWRASRSPRRPTSIQCTGVSRSGHRRGPSVASAEARPHVLVEMTSQPACDVLAVHAQDGVGALDQRPRAPQRLVERAPWRRPTRGSSVPTPPSRITQRCSAIDRAMRS